MSPAQANALNTLTLEAETILGTLSDLLDSETLAVRTADFSTFRNLQSDKIVLLQRYKSLIETLKTQKSALEKADEATSKRLKKSIAHFQECIHTNTNALEAGSKSIQRVTDRIIKGARDSVQGRPTYNGYAKSHTNANMAVSITVDEVL